MKYKILVSDEDIETLDFIPTICVSFYESGNEEQLQKQYMLYKEHFPTLDMIGCSSESNIYNQTPYVDLYGKYACIFIFFDMNKEAYRIQMIDNDSLIKSNNRALNHGATYHAMVLTTLEYAVPIISEVNRDIGEGFVYGAVASTSGTSDFVSDTIFYNGKFFQDFSLVWLIDDAFYFLQGLSIHTFEPVGFKMEITEANGRTIYEIENEQALDKLESIMGTLTEEGIESFDYPFFISGGKDDMLNTECVLYSLDSIDREKKSITMYKPVQRGQTLTISVPASKKERERRILSLKHALLPDSFNFLFLCLGMKKHLGELESIYLMYLDKKLSSPFIGFHAAGEIGSLTSGEPSVLQNQTLTFVSLAEKG